MNGTSSGQTQFKLHSEAMMQLKEIRVNVPLGEWIEVKQKANALRLTVGQWVWLSARGMLAVGSREAPVEAKTTQPLWQRIEAAMQVGGMHRREAGPLAKRLGVSRRAVEGSLGSMVASKRLIREGDVYRRVER